jgi:hypothetical protein
MTVRGKTHVSPTWAVALRCNRLALRVVSFMGAGMNQSLFDESKRLLLMQVWLVSQWSLLSCAILEMEKA